MPATSSASDKVSSPAAARQALIVATATSLNVAALPEDRRLRALLVTRLGDALPGRHSSAIRAVSDYFKTAPAGMATFLSNHDGFAGQRLSKLYREDIAAAEIKPLLAPIFHHYAKARKEGERFGDFCIREGYVAATIQGPDFHKNLKPEALAPV